MATFGERVKQARDALGLSQKELGERVNLSQQAITKIENKAKSSNYILELAEALSVSPEWLKSGKDVPKKSFFKFPLSDWDNLSVEKQTKELLLKDNYIYLQVDDDSMCNTRDYSIRFVRGTIIIVDPDRKPKRQDFVIARHKDRPNSRPIFRMYGTDYIEDYLVPLNMTDVYQSYNARDFEILGVVVASMNLDL